MYKILNSDYYKKQDSDKLSKAAIDGMVKELKDPYSEYLTKNKRNPLMKVFQVICRYWCRNAKRKNDQIMVMSRNQQGSPAERAGIRPEDVITKVNGKSIKGKALDEVVKDVRGKENTEVTLLFNEVVKKKTLRLNVKKFMLKVLSIRKKVKLELLLLINSRMIHQVN